MYMMLMMMNNVGYVDDNVELNFSSFGHLCLCLQLIVGFLMQMIYIYVYVVVFIDMYIRIISLC